MSFETFTLALPSVVLEVTGKGALISLTALGMVAVLRRASAASRHMLLVLGAGCLLLLPVFTVGLPSRELVVLPAEPVRPVVAEPAQDGPGPLQVVTIHRVQRAAAPASFRLPVASGFALFVLAVAALLLARLALAVWRLGRLYAGSLAAPQGWLEIFDELRGRLEVRLGISSAVAVPVTFGWRRPVVLLPEAARGWEEAQLREALLHELAHVRRHDWALQMIARAARALHWFDPLVWLLSRRLLLEAELACDDQVLRAGAGPADYAGRLVALAREARSAARRPAEAVSFARPSGLASRVASILDPRRRRGAPGRIAVAGTALAALILLLVVAPARLVRAEQRSTGLSSSMSSSSGPSLPPLFVAAREGQEEEVRLLLAAGVPPDLAPEGEGTPLMIAAEQGHEGVVKALVDAGADPNVVIPGKGTPLIAAARGGDVGIVYLLLSLTTDSKLVITDEEAFRQATKHDTSRDFARMLINGRKYLMPESMYKKAVREEADGVEEGKQESLIILKGQQEGLIEAAKHGSIGAVRALLRQGADPNGTVSGDENLLIQAAGRGHLEVVRVLLDAGADPNLQVMERDELRTPLVMARRGGHREVERLLLERGARD